MALLVEAASQGVAKALVDAVARGTTFAAPQGKVVAATLPGATIPEAQESRLVVTDRLGAGIAYGTSVLKLFYRMEEGTAPELEVGRFLHARNARDITPAILGYLEYRSGRAEPVTLGVVEEYVLNEGTAWEHARSELDRAYERVLAQPADAPAPSIPTQPLLDLAYLTPPESIEEMIESYGDWAMILGKKTAQLHLALASGTEPAFEPHAYSAMDQRSKYQTARNLVGRVIGGLRRSLHELPPQTREAAERVVLSEERVLARFEPLLTHRIDAVQIRNHGDLHLGRALFTGKDFVILGVGGGRDRRVTERRRKASALRDVASMVRSFHYAAATSIRALRPEDQVRAEPWGWVWQRWVSAAFLRGYLEVAGEAPFVPKNPAMRSLLLEAATIEKAFTELRSELRRRPDMAWIPLQGILRLLGA
jgi:maltose alpha-D-glucosyltransferase/alpha-amylase